MQYNTLQYVTMQYKHCLIILRVTLGVNMETVACSLALSNSFVPESSTQELKEYIQFNVNFTINCVNMERNEGRNITLHFCHT